MLFFASFPTPKPLQAEIHQLPAPPLSKLFTTTNNTPSKRLSTSSSIFSSLGFQKSPPISQQPQYVPRAIPRLSKCTHQNVTRYYTAASTSTPEELKMQGKEEAHEYCQRCRKQHWFRWVYVCDMCSARACHNCRPKWAERAWGSFGSLDTMMENVEEPRFEVKREERVERSMSVGEEKKLKRRSKRWSGSAWLRELKEGT